MIKYKLYSIAVFVLFFICCDLKSQDAIDVNIEGLELPVIARMATDDSERIITISFPGKIIISNNSDINKTFLRLYYDYGQNIPNYDQGGFGMDLFIEEENSLRRIQNKKQTLKAKDVFIRICYSSHYLDSMESKILLRQRKKANLVEKDTLHIGTVAEFKKKHKALFEKLTKGDSISVQFLEGKKLGERITVPVEW